MRILSIDAKDICISNNMLKGNSQGYNTIGVDGKHRLGRFINSFDYSLDLIKLKEIYYKKYRRTDFGFVSKGKEYTTNIINVTFKYSNKEFNEIRKGTYVKFGYDLHDLEFEDCIAKNEDGELIGVVVDQEVASPVSDDVLGSYFGLKTGKLKKDGDDVDYYAMVKQPKILNSRADLRNTLYKNGFICNGKKYVRIKRSSGSARVGKCLFVNEELFSGMTKWQKCGLDIREGQELDLAAFESYISLTTSSIIDTIEIDPASILVVDDFDSIFYENVMATSVENGWLKTVPSTQIITNSIWDGESIADKSLFGKYENKGMLLLRNMFFKSCCFNGNIQQWFADNGITEISQLNGVTIAESVSQIKLITTPSSIKYVKFGSLEQWFHTIDHDFGVVKYEKPTHYFGGRMVQTHYQLINTLEMTRDDVAELLKPCLDFATLLRNDPAVVKMFIKYPEDVEVDKRSLSSRNDLLYALMSVNDRFEDTKYYKEFVDDLLRSYYKNIKNGHVYVHGNYSTLLGNPIELLQHSIGKFYGENVIPRGTIRCSNFSYDTELLGSRSPHVSTGNILVVENKDNEQIAKYINTTNEIVCINSIGENILQRLSGADFDSDTMLLTDNPILLNAAKKNYHVFKVPTSLVEARKTKRYYTADQKCDLDIKTSVNKIGEIINLSQVLNSVYWDRISKGATHEENLDLYTDICTLSVLSGIAIDQAKKEFEIDPVKELNKIRTKYSISLTDLNNKKILPFFFSHISRQKGFYNKERKSYNKHNTSMDFLQTIVNGFRTKNQHQYKNLPLSVILDSTKYYRHNVNEGQISRIRNSIYEYQSQSNKIFCQADVDKDTKYQMVVINKERLTDSFMEEKIGFSTLFSILNEIELEENKKIKTVMMDLLFSVDPSAFLSAIEKSKTPSVVLEKGDGDINIFGENYRKITKNSLSG